MINWFLKLNIMQLLILVCLLGAGAQLLQYLGGRAEAGQSDTEGVVATCDAGGKTFVVQPRFGELMAVETPTGMTLGVPERWPDGQIMITASGGRMINATACLGQHSSWFAVKAPATQAR